MIQRGGGGSSFKSGLYKSRDIIYLNIDISNLIIFIYNYYNAIILTSSDPNLINFFLIYSLITRRQDNCYNTNYYI